MKVAAFGYAPRVRPVVGGLSTTAGVPLQVTDLDVALIQLDHTTYLPPVRR